MDVWHFEKQGPELSGNDLPLVISAKNSANSLRQGIKGCLSPL